jgi:amino acid adenylation domain-containing protein
MSLRSLNNDCTAIYDSRLDYLHEPVLAQALTQPTGVAVVSNGCSVTYQDLAYVCAAICSRLESPAPDSALVAVLMDKGWQQVAACLGILKSGYGYVPMSLHWPHERIFNLFSSVAVRYVITTSAVKKTFESVPEFNHYQWLCVDQLPDAHFPLRAIEQDLHQIAYVIFTSGSTGVPKGVVISHCGAANTILSVNEHFNINHNDAVLGLSELSFDLSVYDIFGVLAAGGRLVLPDSSKRNSPQHWVELISKNKISIWNSVPMFMNMLVTYLNGMGSLASTVFPSVRVILLSGDCLPIPLIAEIRKYFPNARIVSLGGATEASIWSIWYEVRDIDASWKSIPYGAAMPNQDIRILNKELHNCVEQEVGHIHIGGAGVALGYWKDEKRTTDQFFIHPISGERLYSTGDLGRFLPNGEVEFLGREDTQVKIGGHRIELGEIESVANRYAGIKHSVAVAYPEHSSIYLYVVPELDDPSVICASTKKSNSFDRWKEIYEQTYKKYTGNSTFNTSGWVSSFTGKPYSDLVMQEWVDLCIERLTQFSPRKVLEMGCGTGLILFRLAPNCVSYRGVDISEQAIEYVGRVIHESGGMENVDLICCGADEFEKFGDQKYDTIILNSMVQYFPDEKYLSRLIEYYAENLLTEDGIIYVGDVINYDLSGAFQASALKYKDPDITRNALRAKLHESVLSENELHLSPRYFQQLATQSLAINTVECYAKTGKIDSEMNLFRYDAVLYKKEARQYSAYRCTDFIHDNSYDHTRDSLGSGDEIVCLYNIANRKLDYHNQLIDWVDTCESGNDKDFEDYQTTLATRSMNTDELIQLADKSDFEVKIVLHADHKRGNFDAIFVPTKYLATTVPKTTVLKTRRTPIALMGDKSVSDTRALSNSSEREIYRQIKMSLPGLLKSQLPDYMLPNRTIFLETLPLSQNGKVDRKQLPFIGKGRLHNKQSYVAPSNERENNLVSLFAAVLHDNIDEIGTQDSFFELGGDSLLAVGLVTLAWQNGIDINFEQVYQTPTVAGLSEYCANCAGLKPQPIARSSVPATLPLLPNQAPYEYIQCLSVITYLLKPIQTLHINRLESVLQLIVSRHESLRIQFVKQQDKWVQRVFPYNRQPIVHVYNLNTCKSVADRNNTIEKRCNELTSSLDVEHRSFGLRVALFEWNTEQRFFLAIDHYCMDQLSMALFWSEMDLAYHFNILPPLKSSYREIVHTLFNKSGQWDWREDSEFWGAQLSQVKTIPTKPQNSTSDSSVGMKDITLEIAAPWVEALLNPNKDGRDLSVHDIMLTAWVQTLSRWMGQEGVVLILGTHNRDLVESMMQTMGCFITSYPLYLSAGLHLTESEAVCVTHDKLKTIPHKGTRYTLSLDEPQWREFVYGFTQPFLGFNFLGEEELVQQWWEKTDDSVDHKQVVVSHGQQQEERYKSVDDVPYLVMLSKVNRASKTLTLTAEYAATCYSTDTVEHLLSEYRERIALLLFAALNQ